MLNASVGMQRVLDRLHPTFGSRTSGSIRFHHRSVRAARTLQVRASSLAATAHAAPRRASAAASTAHPTALRPRLGHDGVLPVAVVAIILAASLLSWLPGTPASARPVGGTDGSDPGSVAALGSDDWAAGDGYAHGSTGGTDGAWGQPIDVAGTQAGSHRDQLDPEAVTVRAEAAAAPEISGPFLADGTLLKPIAVDTTVADGKDLLRTYTVRSGDTLTGIANRFGVSMMTIWWANKLEAKDALHIGQKLTIPPVNGLVVTVREGDTLESVAAAHDVSADEVYETNGLEDRTLVAGQTLVLPGAVGKAIATPKPKPVTKPAPAGSGSSGGSVRPPANYSGGIFAWPVVGGGNYISQYYHYGHYAIDIAADYGSRVRAAAGGTVIFAGWKSNGGGYQVWIAHGGGLYTTYNHMSAVSVGRGQGVGKGQQVGRVGQSGWATGPHLHFEVWRGPVWNGGQRVNPMRYF